MSDPLCKHCGWPIRYDAGSAVFIHKPPYSWGSAESEIPLPPYWTQPNPEWHNGYWCDRERTTSATPRDDYRSHKKRRQVDDVDAFMAVLGRVNLS